MHKAKKKQLRSWLRIGLTDCLATRLTTPYPTHFLINLTIDVGRSWNRRRPAIHPHRIDGWGIPPNSPPYRRMGNSAELVKRKYSKFKAKKSYPRVRLSNSLGEASKSIATK